MADEPAGAGDVRLGPRERAVLAVLARHGGRVIARDRLRHDAGLDDLNPRRCDSAVVAIRRVLGPGAVVTIRRRGWRLSPDAVALAMAIVASVG